MATNHTPQLDAKTEQKLKGIARHEEKKALKQRALKEKKQLESKQALIKSNPKMRVKYYQKPQYRRQKR